MQWVHAALGLVMFAGGLLGAALLISDGLSAEDRWPAVLGGAFLILFLAATLWTAWPIVALVLDLIRGTHSASDLIEARRVSDVEAVRGEFHLLRGFVDWGGVVAALVAPALWWGMRVREPESRRHWVVLTVGLVSGAVAVLHDEHLELWNLLGVAAPAVAMHAMLMRHDLAVVLALNWSLVWVLVLAGSTWTGLPVGPLTSMLFAMPMLPWSAGEYLELSWWGKAGCWVGATMLGGLVAGVQSAERDAELARRARRARILSARLRDMDDHDRPQFALYLRRFSTTGTLDTQEVSEDVDPLDFETVLSQAVRPELHLLGLNREGAAAVVGADYLFGADEEWEATFVRLARTASLIVLVPPDRGSTLKEIRWLVDSRLLGKTVFVMPETVTSRGFHAYAAAPERPLKMTEERIIDHSATWEAELPSQTFCTFPREFSSLRRPGLLSGSGPDPGRGSRVYSCDVRSPVSPGFVSGSSIQRSRFLVDNLSKRQGIVVVFAAELASGDSQKSVSAVTTTRAGGCRMSVQTAGL
jgi:hypothetical protein